MAGSSAPPKLLHGPYTAPRCRPGDWLDDQIDGALQVGGWTEGRIAWPRRKKRGLASLILCGDLARAVRTESSEAVQHWWGVGPVTVAKWRRALGVNRQNNEGTQVLYRQLAPAKLTQEAAARGRAAAASPASLKKMADSRRGKPAHPNTKAALLKAAKRPKPPGWGLRANAKMLGRELPSPDKNSLYSLRELQMLRDLYPHRPAADVAAMLGRTVRSVRSTARLHHIDGLSRREWSEADDAFLRAHYTVEGPAWCAGNLGRSHRATWVRAHQMGLTKPQRPKKSTARSGMWTAAQDERVRAAYVELGAEVLAQELGRTAKAVYERAHSLGIVVAAWGRWSQEEDDLLRKHYRADGPASCAQRVGRAVKSTVRRAAYLGLQRKRVRPAR